MRRLPGPRGLVASRPLSLPLLASLLCQAAAVRRPEGAAARNSSALLRGAPLQALAVRGAGHAGRRHGACAAVGSGASGGRGPTHYKASGCWKTSKLHHSVHATVQVESVEECFAFCAKQQSPGDMGLSYFGIEGQDKCWCAAAYEGAEAGAGACGSTCKNGEPGCGGAFAANIYVTFDCSQYQQAFGLNNLVGGNELGKAALKVVDAAASLQYSTMSQTDSFVSVPALLMQCKYIQGGNQKGLEPQGFTTNVPVTVFVAVDGRVTNIALAPDGFLATGANVSWTDGNVVVPFPIFRKDFAAGQVRFQFKSTCLAGVFVMEQAGVQISDVLQSSSSKRFELVDVASNTMIYSVERQDLQFINVGAKYQGGKFIRSGTDKDLGDTGFTAVTPVTVYIAIDSQVDHKAAAPAGFLATGDTLDFVRGSVTVPFHVYVRSFGTGKARFHLRRRCAAGVFVVAHEEAAEVAAAERDVLLRSYGAFSRQSCGQASGNELKIGGVSTLLGSLDRCKLACWNGIGSMECHGFTYDKKASKCTFHYDVLNGAVTKGQELDCYFKIS